MPHVTLNSDGRRHPIENGLAVFTLITGVVSFASGWVVSQHMIATITGAAALADKVNGWHQGVTEEKSGKASVNEDDHSAPGALTPMKYL